MNGAIGPGARRGAARPALAAAVALLLGLSSPTATALDPGAALTQYGLDVWPAETSLPATTVQAMAQTKDGYLWLGTIDGLVRFDGVRFTLFNRRATPALKHDSIRALWADADGSLWIGTNGGGLTLLRGGVFTTFTVNEGLVNDVVRALFRDRAGTLWIGTNGGGISKLAGGTFSRLTKKEGLPSDVVRVVYQARDGSMWIGTNGAGAAHLANGTITVYGEKEGISHGDVRSFAEGPDGTLYIATDGGGVDVLANGRLAPLAPKGDAVKKHVDQLVVDAEANVWMASGAGLQRLTRGVLSSLGAKEGLPGEALRSLLLDREGSLWVGGRGGLSRLRDGKLTVWGAPEGVKPELIGPVLEDRSGTVWIAATGALYRISQGAVSLVTDPKGPGGETVRALCEDHAGAVFMATTSGRLYRYAGGVFDGIVLKGARLLEADAPSDAASERAIVALAAGPDGTMYLGTSGGGVLVLRGSGELTRYSTREGLTNDIVRALLLDRSGTLWIGTNGGGLNRLKDGRLDAFTTKDGLGNDRVFCFHEDAEGVLWVGTVGGGLNRLTGGRFVSFGAAAGLFDDVVYTIQEDARGGFWMSSNRGIFRVARADLDAYRTGRLERIPSVSYGIADGLRASECNGGFQPAGAKGPGGRLWFPTVKGAASIDPARIVLNRTPPPVLVEEAVVDGRPLPLGASSRGEPPRIPPGAEKLEVRYTALSFLAPERSQFRYRLEGFDRDWVDAGTRRTAYYTHVPHGSYTFRVKASNGDGFWNETGASFSFRVEPFFHETVWFRALVALALLGVVVGGVRLRLRTLERREKELVLLVKERTREVEAALGKEAEARHEAELEREEAERQRLRAEEANQAKSGFLANMSHELRTPLNAILGFVQLMERKPGRDAEDREHLGIVSRSGEHLLGLINDVLSLSKIEAGHVRLNEAAFDLPELLVDVRELLSVRAAAKGLALEFEASSDLPRRVLGDESKVRQILLNLLGNALKFTEKGSVTLRARRLSERRLAFEVADTGPGVGADALARLFTPFFQEGSGRRSREGTGLGLSLSRSYARLMGGDITVASREGQGTVFTVEVDLPPAEEGGLLVRTGRQRRRVVGLEDGQRRFRILVVDDAEENRLLLSRLLGSVGFEVLLAKDGQEAVSSFGTARPDFVWMDIRMPNLDGLAATRAIRDQEVLSAGGRRAAIVALSASAMDHERDAILRSGCDDFLAKPFREEALFAVMAERLGVRYRYSGSEPAPAPPAGAPERLTVERFVGIPAAWLSKMHQAVVEGDADEAGRLARELSPADPELAEDLRRRLKAYLLDELEAVLQEALHAAVD